MKRNLRNFGDFVFFANEASALRVADKTVALLSPFSERSDFFSFSSFAISHKSPEPGSHISSVSSSPSFVLGVISTITGCLIAMIWSWSFEMKAFHSGLCLAERQEA